MSPIGLRFYTERLRFASVPLWRSGSFVVYLKLQNGEYINLDRSIAIPILTAEAILRFLALKSTIGETRLVKQFRQWVKANVT
jgi:hypothetical protein